MLAYAPCNRPWNGSEQVVADLFLHLHLHFAVGGDDERVSIFCVAPSEEGRLLGTMGTNSIDDDVDIAHIGCTIEELGCEHLHAIFPGERVRLYDRACA